MSKTKELQELLRRRLLISTSDDDANRFSGGVFLTEVTHPQHRTRADALFIGMTNQSGRRLDGYEIKISRGDWLRELRSPTKADAWADECQSWTIVAEEGVVKEEELPEGFGLLERRERKTVRLVQVVKPRIVTRVPSWDAMFGIISAIEREKRKRVDEALEKSQKQVAEISRELYHEKTKNHSVVKNQRAENVLKALEVEFGFIQDPASKDQIHRGMSITKVLNDMRPFLSGENDISSVVGNGFYGLLPTAKMLNKQLEKVQNALHEIEAKAEELKNRPLRD